MPVSKLAVAWKKNKHANKQLSIETIWHFDPNPLLLAYGMICTQEMSLGYYFVKLHVKHFWKLKGSFKFLDVGEIICLFGFHRTMKILDCLWVIGLFSSQSIARGL